VKLKVCHVAASAEGCRWMVEQLQGLREDYDCEVMAVVGGERGGLIDMLRARNIPYYVEHFDFTSRSGMLRLPFMIFRLARLFRRERPDVVQSHLFFSMVIARFAAWLADVPVRLAMYASPFQLQADTSIWIDRATCWMESMLIPACEKTVALCRDMGVKDERLALVYYGPDERRFDPQQTKPANIRAALGWPPDTPVIAKVAYFYQRLSRSRWIPPVVHERGIKGYDDLVRAAPLVLAEFPSAKFLLIGNGWGEPGAEHMQEVEELVRSLDLEESVIFTGFRSDVDEILAQVNVAVQASLVECLGGTIEALLMECPTVATRVGGMVDTVRDGETGILVEPSNPPDLARGIIQMLRDPERGRAMGRAGRNLMLSRFTLSRTVKDLFEVYRRVRARKGRCYNPLVSLWRTILAVPILTYLSFRMMLVEFLFHIYLPRLKALPTRIHRISRFRLRDMSGDQS
jgi:glycosyltransferase involved in cell wall biosynthesis